MRSTRAIANWKGTANHPSGKAIKGGGKKKGRRKKEEEREKGDFHIFHFLLSKRYYDRAIPDFEKRERTTAGMGEEERRRRGEKRKKGTKIYPTSSVY